MSLSSAPSATGAAEAARRQSILLVDDTAENLFAIGSMLQPHFQVRVANGGGAALEALRRPPLPDLILLDIMMPEIDGYEVLRRLKAAPETAGIPVIFVTAMDTHGDEAHGFELGAVDYITKPVVPVLLLARVRTHLALKAAADTAGRSRSEYLAGMSRELRAPLQDVADRLQRASDLIPAGNPALDHLRQASTSAREALALLDGMLDPPARQSGPSDRPPT